MKLPLLLVSAFYAAGIILAELLRPPIPLLFSVAFLLLAVTLALKRARPWLLASLLLMAGWTNMALNTTPLSPVDLRGLCGNAPSLVTIRGVLRDTPSERITIRNNREQPRSMADVRVTAIFEREKPGWRAASGLVLVTTSGVPPPGYYAGNEVEISGVLAPPPGAVAEGLFDYATYLSRLGIYYQLKADGTNEWRLLSPPTRPPFSERFLTWAQETISRGLPCEDLTLHLLWAMSLGWKAGLTNETYEPFMKSGTMHIFAISGLHIALIAGLLVGILRVCRISRAWCGVVVIPLIWFYTAATGWQPSASRSVVMMTIVIGGWALCRPGNLLNSLAAAAFVILLWDPQQLFGASFQLSFLVVLSIALVLPPVERFLDSVLRHDPLIPLDAIPVWRRRFLSAVRWVASLFATSLAAFLGSFLLTSYYFHLFSPSSLLANLVVVPMSSAALACNVGSMLAGAWLPWVPELLNHSAWFWMRASLWVSETLGNAPFGCISIRQPDLIDFAVYYVCLTGVLSGWVFKRQNLRVTGPAIALLLCFYGGRYLVFRDRVEVTILPLSGCAAVFVDSASPDQMALFDTGTTNDVNFTVKPFLRARGRDDLPWLALSHGDTRHISGAAHLNTLFPVENVAASSFRFRSPVYRRSIDALKESAGTFKQLQNGDSFAGCTVLHPGAGDRFSRADDAVLVAHATIRGCRILLLSDLDLDGQARLLDRHPDLRADILVLEPGVTTTRVDERLLETVKPTWIIVCDTDSRRSEEAVVSLESCLRASNARLLNTRETGAITLRLASSGARIRTMGKQNFDAKYPER
jgi:competence protein ComEC